MNGFEQIIKDRKDKNQKLTQKEMAYHLGISESLMSLYIRDELPIPDEVKLKAMRVFNAPLEYFA